MTPNLLILLAISLATNITSFMQRLQSSHTIISTTALEFTIIFPGTDTIKPNATGIRIPILDKTSQHSNMNTLLENKRNIYAGYDMRNSSEELDIGASNITRRMVLLQEKNRIIQQLESDEISLLEKFKRLQYDFAYIVDIDGHGISKGDINAGGLLDKWNDDEME